MAPIVMREGTSRAATGGRSGGESLTRRLGALLRERRSPSAGAAGGPPAGSWPVDGGLSIPAAPGTRTPIRRDRPRLDGLLPGGEVETPLGPLHLHEVWRGAGDQGYARLLAKLADARERLSLTAPGWLSGEFLDLKEQGLEGALLLDLETAGLAGNPVFLAGLLTMSPEGIRLRQLLARNYLEEPALIAMVAAAVRAHPLLVSYNGKSFDLPMLVDRACRHRMSFPSPPSHLDLLHHARRAFRGRVPNCRLVTLEWLVCERRRFGDVPGREIPGLFHRFARDGDPTAMSAVLHHNALDLVTLAELLAHLVPHPPGPRFVPDEAPGLEDWPA